MEKIMIAAMGSRGDVEPYVALGIELKADGYDVTVSAPRIYESLVRAGQLGFTAMDAVNPQELMKLPEVEAQFDRGHMIGAMAVLMKKAGPVIREFLTESYQNMQGADMVILSMILYGAYDAAEKMKIPCVYTLLNPAVPTRQFPSVVMPHIPTVCNRFSHKLLEWGFYICFKKELNRLRKTCWQLPPLRKCPVWSYRERGGITLLAYSSLLVPKPADWTDREIITGYWQLPKSQDYVPGAALVEFLNQPGEKPVYIGFGSMPVKDPKHFLKMTEQALEMAGERAVVYLSYNAAKLHTGNLSRILLVKDVPHAWLFPQVSATVIHGGAGTCRASLMAGKPTFVSPFMGDQTFWGEQVHNLGAGPAPVKFKDLTASKLAEVLKELTSGKYTDRAAEIGRQLKEEHGTKKAAEAISLCKALHKNQKGTEK